MNYKINKTTLAESFNDIEPEVLNEPEVDEKRAVERRKIPRSFERVGVWRSQGRNSGSYDENGRGSEGKLGERKSEISQAEQ